MDVASEDTRLYCSAQRNDLVGVHTLVWIAARDFLDERSDRWHAGGTADHNHVVKLAFGQFGVRDGLFERSTTLRDQLLGQRFELGAGELKVEVLRAGIGCRDKRQIDAG